MSNDTEHPRPSADAPTSEERLRAITIGDRQPLNAAIELKPYDPAWPSQFLQLAARIRAALTDAVMLLEHVGSTSVPGLAAKPIIDMVLAVQDAADEPSYAPQLEQAGFVLRIREPDWFEHRLLKTPEIDGNLHVLSADCSEIERMLALRNWLRTHDDDRRLYQDTKYALAARTWRHVQHYADAKSDVVRDILARALECRSGASAPDR